MTNPLISCVCVTGKTEWHTRELLPAAIESWKDQGYENKELILISENPLPREREQLELSIRVVLSNETTLGGLRNQGLREARGEVIVQWDDDCYSSPDRLAVQLAVFMQNPTTPVLFKRELLFSHTTDTACIRMCEGTCIHGSIMHPATKDGHWVFYPMTAKAEDTDFLNAWGSHRVMVDNDPALLTSIEHGQNTWPVEHHLREFAAQWGRGQWMLGEYHTNYLRALLSFYPFICNAKTSLFGRWKRYDEIRYQHEYEHRQKDTQPPSIVRPLDRESIVAGLRALSGQSPQRSKRSTKPAP